MSSFEDKAARTSHNMQLVRNAVARGDGAEAKRLADKFRIANVWRLDMGVELSNDPELKKVPKAR